MESARTISSPDSSAREESGDKINKYHVKVGTCSFRYGIRQVDWLDLSADSRFRFSDNFTTLSFQKKKNVMWNEVYLSFWNEAHSGIM